MIELPNGRRFARSGDEMLESLFVPGRTADGLWRPNEGGVLLSRPSTAPAVQVVMNRHGDAPFLVSARRDGRRLRYWYAMTQEDQDWIAPGLSYSEQRALAAEIIKKTEEVPLPDCRRAWARAKLQRCARLARECSRDYRRTLDGRYLRIKREAMSDARQWRAMLYGAQPEAGQ
jgi:hypothetical protein